MASGIRGPAIVPAEYIHWARFGVFADIDLIHIAKALTGQKKKPKESRYIDKDWPRYWAGNFAAIACLAVENKAAMPLTGARSGMGRPEKAPRFEVWSAARHIVRLIPDFVLVFDFEVLEFERAEFGASPTLGHYRYLQKGIARWQWSYRQEWPQ